MRAVSAILCCAVLGTAADAGAAPPSPKGATAEAPVLSAAQLGTGIGLVVVGAGAAAGAGFYALGRLPYDEVEQHGPSGGTLAAVGAIGVVGAAIGVILTVTAVRSRPRAVEARLAPGGASLAVSF